MIHSKLIEMKSCDEMTHSGLIEWEQMWETPVSDSLPSLGHLPSPWLLTDMETLPQKFLRAQSSPV